jgi:hypothetical protein
MARKSNTLNNLSLVLMEGVYLMSVGTRALESAWVRKELLLGVLHFKI